MPGYANAWLMQVNGSQDNSEFDLPGALQAALVRDRTLWLENRQNDDKIQVGDRMYLWSSGVKGKQGKSGQLIAIAKVIKRPQAHPQHEWQAKFNASLQDYDANATRVKVCCEALLDRALDRADVLSSFPAGPAGFAFFRTGNMQTTSRVESELDSLLCGLVEGHLTEVQRTEPEPEQLAEEVSRAGKKIPVGRRKREPLGVGFFLGFVLFFPVGFWV